MQDAGQPGTSSEGWQGRCVVHEPMSSP
jgi:hypothetical protein